MHEQGLRFSADVWGRPQVEITDDQGGSIAAVSSNAARFPFALPPVMGVALIAIVVGGVAWLFARRHGGRRLPATPAVESSGAQSNRRAA